MNQLTFEAVQLICSKFEEVSAGEEFQRILSIENLKIFLALNNLNIASEMVVVNAMHSWISYRDRRKRHLPELIQHIRWTQLDDAEPVIENRYNTHKTAKYSIFSSFNFRRLSD